jgi:hypothetical protein
MDDIYLRPARNTAFRSPPMTPSSPPPLVVDDQLLLAVAMMADVKDARVRYRRAVAALAALEQGVEASNPATRPSDVLNQLLRRRVGSLYERGWQPLDVAHMVKCHTNAKCHRLIVGIIASAARAGDDVQRAPLPWLAQLDLLGVYDAATGRIVGGHERVVRDWARSLRLDAADWMPLALQVLAALATAAPLSPLGEPPSAWSATNRGRQPPPGQSGNVDVRALKIIRGLLAKAEDTEFDAEAEAFTAKAQELMTRYSIDAAVLAAAHVSSDAVTPGVEVRRVHLDSPYADEKATFLSIIAEVNGVRSVWAPHVGSATITGFPVDLQLTDVLFTSLLVQATRASGHATERDPAMRTPSFRRAFMVSFADRIGERLREAQRHVHDQASSQYGAALVPILAGRAAAVEEAVQRMFPNVTTSRRRSYNAHGWYAGRAAADRATLRHGEAIEPAQPVISPR